MKTALWLLAALTSLLCLSAASFSLGTEVEMLRHKPVPVVAKPQAVLQVISLPLGTVCTTPTTQWYEDATGHWATMAKPIK